MIRGLILSVMVLSVMCLEFRSTLSSPSTQAAKFNPTYVQTLRPIGENVLTTDTQNAPYQNPTQIWTENWATVVAVGPDAKKKADISEGDIVYVPPCQNRINLNAANGQAQTQNGLYCIYNINDIKGRVIEGGAAGNRAYAETSRLDRAPGKLFGGWGWN
eukprot:NODE_8113_length_708_cov_181.170940_g7494_i0.p1 GENE.NODE_8113_length_708_cov_181.170940_g7494_i0~~NODE_8113_length_708_cov_181.170940_g7494_i0.p1  ORF type:complete len:160 (+),score=35.16 NODE_8113_length_708_cov_181.170940_g7494_i0:64-543(+)